MTVADEPAGYQVLRELGRGGMGVVYQARQTALDRIVALKTIPPDDAVSPAEFDRLRRETETIARLDHPHIVSIYDVGEHQSRPYFSMKYYAGGNLARQIRGPSADLAAHARLVETIARAVHHAHQRGILHRDLKPSNILLDEDGQPHVVDFGLAARFNSGFNSGFDSNDGATGSEVVGTPSYIAPEQALRKQAITPASDVYGLGTILYELLTGERPFVGETTVATLLQVLERPPRPPRQRNPRVPADLEAICLKCLEKAPRRRYQSALELAEDLERWRKGEPIRARPARLWERLWRWRGGAPSRKQVGHPSCGSRKPWSG
ncbi:MAG: serine/threonine protein kinase [Gemmataceae bacterium]|nr:serine/threonine protein kinase [Gemmataceae bacterium]